MIRKWIRKLLNKRTYVTIKQDYVEFVSSINYRFEKTIDGINFLLLPNE
jgi:hypothetical protein